MATNPYVNKVVYGDQTVMDISDTTAEAADVASGEVFYTASGARSVGTADYYSPSDTAETAIDDADYFPFYDTSATAKKKSLWSNIKAKLNEIFFKRSEQAVLGAKNLLPLNVVGTSGDIEWTIENGTVIANGSAGSSNSQITLAIPSELTGDFYFCGCPVGGGQPYDLYPWDNTTNARPKRWDGTTNAATDIGDGTLKEVQIPSGHTCRLVCRVYAGNTVSNLVFKPILQLATDTDNTFVPFAMSNKQLTDAVSQDASDIDDIEALIPSGASSSNKLATASDIPDITGKADKVSSATSGNFAGLDANGNLTDSGISADIVPSGASSSNKLATANDIPSLTNYVEKSDTVGLLKNDGTVDTTQYVSDISGKVDNSVVAPVESGTTASQAYAIGEHFIKDGAFCTAKTAIASGATFTLNTNYTEGMISEGYRISTYKLIGYTNASAITVNANASQAVTLTTSDTDLSNYVCVGLMNYNLCSGVSAALSLKALDIQGSASSSISGAVGNGGTASVTIPAGKLSLSVRAVKFI